MGEMRRVRMEAESLAEKFSGERGTDGRTEEGYRCFFFLKLKPR